MTRYGFNVSQYDTFDIFQYIQKTTKKAVSLDHMTSTNIGLNKTHNGLHAVSLWQDGDLEELKDYCENDVKITHKLFLHGLKHEELSGKDNVLFQSWKSIFH